MTKSYAIGVVLMILVGILWFNRYTVTAPNQYGAYAKLDRWTGTITNCSVVNGSC